MTTSLFVMKITMGTGTYSVLLTALRKISANQVFEREQTTLLLGRIEIDDAYLCSELPGNKARRAF